jgi:hypothetical protein
MGLSRERLQAMTFDGWASAPGDGAPERFGSLHILKPTRRTRGGRPTCVCPACLAEDREPYLRRLWLTGWAAVCPRHQAVLATNCPHCHAELRAPTLRMSDHAGLGCCHRCRRLLAGLAGDPAHPAVLTLQSAMLTIHRDGRGMVGELGAIGWGHLVAVVDAVLGSIWMSPDRDARERLLGAVAADLNLDIVERMLAPWSQNYGALLILAWLLAGWPHRLGEVRMTLRSPAIAPLLDRQA